MGCCVFAALEGKIAKDYVGQIADHLPIGLFGLYPRLEVEKLTTMFKEREDTIYHLERKCDLLMARLRVTFKWSVASSQGIFDRISCSASNQSSSAPPSR